MPIRNINKPYLGECGFCARDTILRYKVCLKTLCIDICTLCYEEQDEFK